MDPVKEKFLKIAFLTDIHMKWQYLKALKQWYIKHTNSHQPFNYVIIGGDTQNCNNNDLQVLKGSYQKPISQVYGVFDFVKEIFSCPLIYVPGNHDPPMFFEKNHSKREGQTNAHKKRFDLVEGIQIVGYGGSVPGYVKTDQVWQGYPFNNQQQFEKDAQDSQFFNNSKQKSSKQVIILTHDGPQMSSTTHDRRNLESGCISGGVKYFNRFLKNERKDDILIWIHGHVHDAGNLDKINKIQVCNPGPIAFGKFMYIELDRPNFQAKWSVKSKVFQRLNYQ